MFGGGCGTPLSTPYNSVTQPNNPRNTNKYLGVNLSHICLLHNEATSKAHKGAMTSFGVMRKAIAHSIQNRPFYLYARPHNTDEWFL